MMNDENIELPLFDTFMELVRLEKDQPHKSVEPASYLLLIDTIRNGYMINTLEELIFFCKKIWLKPFHLNNNVINEKILEKTLLKNLESYRQALEVIEPEIPVEEREPGKERRNDKKDDDKIDSKTPEEENPAEKPVEAVKVPSLQPSQKTSLVLSIEESADSSSIDLTDYNSLFNNRNYHFNYEYLPVSRRFIEQTIRSLRYKLKGIGRQVIDIEATVEHTAANGYFDDWTMREEDGFITRWTLLLDHEGSMIAFQSLLEVITDAAFRGTIKNEGDVFYFRNVVSDFLFTNPFRTASVPFEKFASGVRRNILIISDAGAARGYRDMDRIQDTYTMLYELRKHRVAWLNPLPKERWKNTSAEDISAFVNMFETGDDYADNLGNIVQMFKSKLVTNSGTQLW